MAYIGNTVQTQGFTPAIDYFNGNGVTVTFTLSRPVASVAQMIVAIDNVIQNPSSSYTVSGNAITFSSAPLSGTNNIWVEYTSLITTYAAISQDPSVIGDITASGGYLAVGDFGNTYVDGTIVDYVTGNARITTGPADGITLYNGGTSARSSLASWDASGNLTNTGNLTVTGQASLGTGQTDYIAAIGGGGTARVEAVGGNTNINLSLSTKGTGAVYFWRGGYGGTNTMLIDASSNLQFNSGYGSVATAYGCRAWVNWNGTGTVSIRASGNVSSITDNGVGNYYVNFTTAMPNANYTVEGIGSHVVGVQALFGVIREGTRATTGFQIDYFNTASGFGDTNDGNAAVFR